MKNKTGLKMKKSWEQILTYVCLAFFVVISAVPFLAMIATAMTPHSYTMPFPPRIFPEELYFQNFIDAWNSNDFGRYFMNSIFVAVVSTLIIILVSCMSAYGFARMQFPGRNVLFYLLMFSMMVPTVTNLVTLFILMKNMQLVDSYMGLILIYVGTGISSNTFFLRSFFLSFPKELEEAVIIDGGGHWTIFFRILLPLSAPAIGTFAIMAFSNVWDEFLFALTLMKTPAQRTLPIALKLFQGQHLNDWSLVFAASLIAVAPILLIYIVMQKKLIRGGIMAGSVKG